MRLSPHFSLNELTLSQTAARRGIDNMPSEAALKNLRRLCKTVLEPIRTTGGHPVVISSGFRCEALNSAVGGARTSAHLTGRAADFVIGGGVPVTEAFHGCCAAIDSLPIDLVIHEFGRWVHIQIAREGTAPRRKMLAAFKSKGRTVYHPFKSLDEVMAWVF